jgi:hypothetical protein
MNRTTSCASACCAVHRCSLSCATASSSTSSWERWSRTRAFARPPHLRRLAGAVARDRRLAPALRRASAAEASCLGAYRRQERPGVAGPSSHRARVRLAHLTKRLLTPWADALGPTE